jgi:hypothetical protein
MKDENEGSKDRDMLSFSLGSPASGHDMRENYDECHSSKGIFVLPQSAYAANQVDHVISGVLLQPCPSAMDHHRMQLDKEECGVKSEGSVSVFVAAAQMSIVAESLTPRVGGLRREGEK